MNRRRFIAISSAFVAQRAIAKGNPHKQPPSGGGTPPPPIINPVWMSGRGVAGRPISVVSIAGA